jgi:molybdopterin-guanine dinucleotide biosynthesis protein B
LRLAVIKHAAAGFEIDQPGKDSFNIRRAGVEQTLLVGGGNLALMERWQAEPPLADVIERHVRRDVDVVITEGYKREPHPKIEVARRAISEELVSPDGELIAVVCDFAPRTTAPVFGLGEAPAVADLLMRQVLGR